MQTWKAMVAKHIQHSLSVKHVRCIHLEKNIYSGTVSVNVNVSIFVCCLIDTSVHSRAAGLSSSCQQLQWN